MLITLDKIGELHFRLLGTNGFHVKAKNERFQYCCELPLSSEQEPIAIQHCLRWEVVGMKPRSSPLVFSSNAQSLGIPIFIQRLRERLVFHS